MKVHGTEFLPMHHIIDNTLFATQQNHAREY